MIYTSTRYTLLCNEMEELMADQDRPHRRRHLPDLDDDRDVPDHLQPVPDRRRGPTLVHTGDDFVYEGIRKAIREVLDPATLANVVLLHCEGDESGGMGRFMARGPGR